MTELKDYRPSDYLIPSVELTFDLDSERTLVHSRLSLQRNPQVNSPLKPLQLDGEGLELLAIAINGKALAAHEYAIDQEKLTLGTYQEPITLEITCAIHPDKNYQLEGLYASQSLLCTQCEAQGFRNITYFLDRPDVLSRWSVRLRAEAKKYPYLLAGGDLIEKKSLADGRHEVLWQDPWPKPSYLFALAAGPLFEIHDTYKTLSGKIVDLFLYCEPHNQDRLYFAMESLKRAFAWDEKVYGREYDLSRFQIVAVDAFNMGAMENKGLNIFNASCLLAEKQATSDDEFRRIEAIIAHEYFHNWTGNRVTCRDWFQLTLKEGLTVYRDHCFSADHHSPQTVRLEQVQALMARQFPEDAGAMAHPIQPTSYKDINNFYTATVYEKGSEIIRMMHLLLGDRFRQGTDCYFQRHDGQAVTTEDFVKALEDGSGIDLSSMRPWYSHFTTPKVTFKREFDTSCKRFILHIEQAPTPNTRGPSQALCMPLQLAIWDPVTHQKLHEELLVFKSWQHSFAFEAIPENALVSLGRSLSAPVIIEDDHTLEERLQLSLIDDDVVMRWLHSRKNLKELYQGYLQTKTTDESAWVRFVEATLNDPMLDAHAKALIIKLPLPQEVLEWVAGFNVEAAVEFCETLQRSVAMALRSQLLEVYQSHHHPQASDFTKENSASRYLKQAAIEYLCALEESSIYERLWKQQQEALCMSDEAGAFRLLCSRDNPFQSLSIAHYEKRWNRDLLTWPRWFSAQSSSQGQSALKRCQELFHHPLFNAKIPNQARALIAGFSMNVRAFHSYACEDVGAGYRWMAECVLSLDAFNAQMAAKLAKAFSIYPRLTGKRANSLKSVLQNLLDTNLSVSTREVIQKCLD